MKQRDLGPGHLEGPREVQRESKLSVSTGAEGKVSGGVRARGVAPERNLFDKRMRHDCGPTNLRRTDRSFFPLGHATSHSAHFLIDLDPQFQQEWQLAI